MDSHSQYKQDLWVASLFPRDHQGVFVELGAGDGQTFSNTVMLEEQFGWTGLLIEPHPAHYTALLTARPNCQTSDAVIDGKEKIVDYWFRGGWISGIVDSDTKQAKQRYKAKLRRDRQRGAVRKVPTRTLADVFSQFQMPSTIDYFSLDVEGAEYRIMKNFPFDRWKFLCATIESPCAKLDRLLQNNGYEHVANLGEDFCYVHESMVADTN